MHTHRKINFYLNNCGDEWQYALETESKLKPLKAASFKAALKEVHRIIESNYGITESP